MLTETRRRGCDGVVCGHIHKPEIRKVDGLIYANDGDWVESLSALVEHHDGTLELIDWQNAAQKQTWRTIDQLPMSDSATSSASVSA